MFIFYMEQILMLLETWGVKQHESISKQSKVKQGFAKSQIKHEQYPAPQLGEEGNKAPLPWPIIITAP